MKRFLVLAFVCISSVVFGQWDHEYIGRARAFLNRGELLKARQILHTLLEYNPESVPAHLLLAESYAPSNDYKESAGFYKQAWSLDSSAISKDWLLKMGLVFKQNGDYKDAKRTFDYLKIRAKNEQSYYWLKSQQEINTLDVILHGRFQMYPTEVFPMQFANTYDAEFAGIPVDEHRFLFNRIQGLYEPELDDGMKLIKSSRNTKRRQEKVMLHKFGQTFYTTNVQKTAYSDNVFFTRCDTGGTCRIFTGRLKNKRIAKEKEVWAANEDYSSSTHPYAVMQDGQVALYFSSNRKGGYGGYDLYVIYRDSLDDDWTEPENLGDSINSAEDEITPFYDVKENYLYFASTWHPGFGGFDIFQSAASDSGFHQPVNIGYPFNTPANDIYFYLYPGGDRGIITSNREGSLTKQGLTCCNDLYGFDWPPTDPIENVQDSFPYELYPMDSLEKKITLTDVERSFEIVKNIPDQAENTPVPEKPAENYARTYDATGQPVHNHPPEKPEPVKSEYAAIFPPGTAEKRRAKGSGDNRTAQNKRDIDLNINPATGLPVPNIVVPKDPDSLVTVLENIIPIQLYFHNDEPNPRTWSKQTEVSYKESFVSYQNRQKEYEQVNDNMASITRFFENDLLGEYQKLVNLTAMIQEAMHQNMLIRVQVRGYCSPLGRTLYNDLLGSRRTESLRNFFRQNDEVGNLAGYMDKDSPELIISQTSFGERTAADDISDEPGDVRNSIYSLAAMRERRIEIEAVNVSSGERLTPDGKTTGNKQKPGEHVIGEIRKNEDVPVIHVSVNESVRESMQLKNPWNERFVIDEIETACGCTDVVMNARTIPANGTISFFIDYTQQPEDALPTEKLIRFISLDSGRRLDYTFKVLPR